MNPSERTLMPPIRSLLRPLGIVGYDAAEPALLAALATEEPLLLLSDHGAAKTLLLVRLADALGLELRHYNASLLQFDDLLGFPIPDERGGVRYAAPPGAIWGAQAVFFDEIGRCRPESANKLFPLIHERRLQGLELSALRYRWAATNPPAEALAADRIDDPYEGVEPLDPALADRFSYIVALPRFDELSDDDQRSIIRGAADHPPATGGAAVRELVQATRELIAACGDEVRDAIAAYVHVLLGRLGEARLAAGGRRAATLCRNLVAVRAACTALGRNGAETPFIAALSASIPEVVRRAVPRAVILAAHKAAWQMTSIAADDPLRVIESVRDPLRRALLTVTMPRLRRALRGELLCGAVAALPAPEAEILGWHLLPRLLDRPIVPAFAVETVAQVVSRVAEGGQVVRGWGTAQEWVRLVRERIAATRLADNDAEYLFAVMVSSASPSPAMTGATEQREWEQRFARYLEVWTLCATSLGAASTDWTGSASDRAAA
jgi:MoxR-like ATPase